LTPAAGFDPDRVEVLLCDADGNLFPSEEPAFAASARVTNRFMSAFDLETRFTAEELRRATTGKNFRTTAVELAARNGVPLDAAVVRQHPEPIPAAKPVPGRRRLTAEELERWVREEKHEVTAHLSEALAPDPAVIASLRHLSETRTLSVVTSSALSRLAASLRAAGLEELFPPRLRFSAEDSLPAPASKPDPAIYLHAGERLGIAPAQGLAIEDSLAGAQSAIAAGYATIGNLVFVPPAERRQRGEDLRHAGVVDVLGSWGELERMLAPRAPRGAGSPTSVGGLERS